MPWIEHTQPKERPMPKHVFGDEDNYEYTLLPAGDYMFEVLGVEFGIQSGGKTNGSETMTLDVGVFSDPTFQKRLSKWNELMIFHPSTAWKVDTFVKSANILVDSKPPHKDQELDFSEHMLVGLRGWCTVGQRKYQRRDGTEATANNVVTWLTNKAKLPKHAVVLAPRPSVAHADGDLPF